VDVTGSACGFGGLGLIAARQRYDEGGRSQKSDNGSLEEHFEFSRRSNKRV
jgi:hypothetical protein